MEENWTNNLWIIGSEHSTQTGVYGEYTAFIQGISNNATEKSEDQGMVPKYMSASKSFFFIIFNLPNVYTQNSVWLHMEKKIKIDSVCTWDYNVGESGFLS